MKKFLIVVGVIIGILLILGYVFRGVLQMAVAFYAMRPDAGFAETTPPKEPDYAVASSWAALPGRDDLADRVPIENTPTLQSDAEVDVFYVHPTTLLGGCLLYTSPSPRDS